MSMKMTKVDALNVALSALNNDTYDIQYNAIFADGTPTIHTETYTKQEVQEVIERMIAQLSKPRVMSDEAKAKRKAKTAQARAALMEQVLPVLRGALASPMTAKELFAACADALPEDFTALKVQYILLHEMANEVIKTEAKGHANTYQMKG